MLYRSYNRHISTAEKPEDAPNATPIANLPTTTTKKNLKKNAPKPQ